MEIVYPRCAGLDVHKKTVVACRVAPRGKQRHREVRSFGTTVRELLALQDWLHEWGITHVAMESTGEYWRPIYNVLEGHFELLLVNAQHVKQVPGRKTDVKDAEWLADLLRHGLLKASYVPEKEQRELRDLTRYRIKLVQQRAQVVNRLQKVLEGTGIKLSSVVSSIVGVSGRAMLDALIAGETDSARLAELARGRLKSKQGALEAALEGQMDDHHRFMLTHELALFDFLSAQIEQMNERIEMQMTAMDATTPPEPPAAPDPDAAPHAEHEENDEPPSLSHAEAVALLDTIPGVDQQVAEIIVAELGTDMTRFPTARHAAAWAGVAPGHNESAGKRRSGQSRRGNRWLRAALAQAAWAASHTKDTYLAAQFHRLAARRGKKRAIVAVGHSILVIAYHMLRKRQPYRELGHDFFDQRKRDTTVRHLIRRLEKLGVEVPDQAPAVVS
ncbi:MAG: IS110 family transposase [Caldilineaceae bacterium]